MASETTRITAPTPRSAGTLHVRAERPKTDPSQLGAAAQSGAGRALESDALLQGRSQVSIAHRGETYQLRTTRLGKLILTK